MDYLKKNEETDIIMIGVSTDSCMDATVKSGFEHGYHVIIPAYANTTYENPYFSGETAYRYFNEFMCPKRYAKTVTVEEAVELMKLLQRKD